MTLPNMCSISNLLCCVCSLLITLCKMEELGSPSLSATPKPRRTIAYISRSLVKTTQCNWMGVLYCVDVGIFVGLLSAEKRVLRNQNLTSHMFGNWVALSKRDMDLCRRFPLLSLLTTSNMLEDRDVVRTYYRSLVGSVGWCHFWWPWVNVSVIPSVTNILKCDFL